jgi:hypothetical protein
MPDVRLPSFSMLWLGAICHTLIVIAILWRSTISHAAASGASEPGSGDSVKRPATNERMTDLARASRAWSLTALQPCAGVLRCRPPLPHPKGYPDD